MEEISLNFQQALSKNKINFETLVSYGHSFFRKIKGGHNQSNSLYRYEQVE